MGVVARDVSATKPRDDGLIFMTFDGAIRLDCYQFDPPNFRRGDRSNRVGPAVTHRSKAGPENHLQGRSSVITPGTTSEPHLVLNTCPA
jgi:hypothetical protein